MFGACCVNGRAPDFVLNLSMDMSSTSSTDWCGAEKYQSVNLAYLVGSLSRAECYSRLPISCWIRDQWVFRTWGICCWHISVPVSRDILFFRGNSQLSHSSSMNAATAQHGGSWDSRYLENPQVIAIVVWTKLSFAGNYLSRRVYSEYAKSMKNTGRACIYFWLFWRKKRLGC